MQEGGDPLSKLQTVTLFQSNTVTGLFISIGDQQERSKPVVANLSPTMHQLFIIRFQMRHNLHKSWRKYFPPMSRLFTKTKI